MTRDPSTIQREHAQATLALGHLQYEYEQQRAKLMPQIDALAAELHAASVANSPEAKRDAEMAPTLERLAKLEAWIESVKPNFDAEGEPTGKVLVAKTGAVVEQKP